MSDTLTLNYETYDDALKVALSGKEPGEDCVITVRAKVVTNDDESVTLAVDEVSVDEAYSEDAEAEDEEMDEDEAPAMIIAVGKKKPMSDE